VSTEAGPGCRAREDPEFGYLLLRSRGGWPAALFAACQAAVSRNWAGRLCGVDVHDDLRLEGRFFNIHAEGRRVRDRVVLGLQWMIDFQKDASRQRRHPAPAGRRTAA